jgi:hypothetical protein
MTLPTTIQDEVVIVVQEPQQAIVLELPAEEESVCKTIYSFIVHIYSTIKDLILLVVVMIMSFFLYDVHVSIVKADETPLGDSLWTGRVVIQSQEGQIHVRRQLQTSVV